MPAGLGARGPARQRPPPSCCGRPTLSLDGDYDPDNIFAKIVRGEAPAAKVYEDHDTLAFMDVFPQGPGHVLVVHKRSHARNLMDAEPAELASVIATVQRMVLAVRAAMK